MSLLAQAADGAAAGGSTAEVVLFWIFAVIALGAAIGVVTMRNIVHGALMLVVNLLAVAGLYLSLESPFLSIIQVLVYAGAIMVLFLFVIMLLGVDRDDLLLATDLRSRVLAVAGGALLAGALLFGFVGPYTGDASICPPEGGTAAAGVGATGDGVPCVGLAGAKDEGDEAGVAFLGRQMFTRYTLPFELSALLLTVATIGAVLMARRRDLAPDDIEVAADAQRPGPVSDADVLAAGDQIDTGEEGVDVHAGELQREQDVHGEQEASGTPRLRDDREG
ncbi:NADH-quinone oxidoreductase subunit J [Egicoccus sp. AB-alg2]|uniref:NADH-quinone oxidoreductase subunit J family protein n=1 Tax=Egicoccus sp. AB-alg2 TaxID=3242693 RepID=UPI00359E5A13